MSIESKNYKKTIPIKAISVKIKLGYTNVEK